MQALLRAGRKSYRLSAAGPLSIKHSWAYLPDVARTITALAAMQEQLPAFSVFHFKGYQLSFADLAEAIQTASGRPVRKTHFPWVVIRLLSPFSAMFRGLIEMRYLWNQEINLDQTKLVQTLNGKVPYTEPTVALLESGLVAPSGGERIHSAIP